MGAKEKAPIDDKINERTVQRHNDPVKRAGPFTLSRYFTHAKKAGARKSSPAKIGKEAGFSCEAAMVHEKIPHLQWLEVFYTLCRKNARVICCGKVKNMKKNGRDAEKCTPVPGESRMRGGFSMYADPPPWCRGGRRPEWPRRPRPGGGRCLRRKEGGQE